MTASGRLQGRIALVTGASSGVGRGIALRFAREGAAVVCADLQATARVPRLPEDASKSLSSNNALADAFSQDEKTPTHELIVQHGGQAIFMSCDVTQPEQARGVVNGAVESFGRLDILVNNAGVGLEAVRPGMLHETSVETWDKTLAINARGVFLCSKYTLAHMIRQEPTPTGSRGCIINISSIHGLVGGNNNPSYCASKGAVANLTRQSSLDYARYGIHINAICPGHIKTAIFEETRANMVSEDELRALYPLAGDSQDGDRGIGGLQGHYQGPGVNGARQGRLGRPDDVAGAAVWLASDDASWVTGICLPIDGGYTAR